MSLKLDTAMSVYAVVEICVLLVPALAVGADGVPVNVGLTFSPCTNAVVATNTELSPYTGVGAFTSPVNVGAAIGAAPVMSVTDSVTAPVLLATDNTGADDLTNAVVAIFVLTSPSLGLVTIAGTPVNNGLSIGAFNRVNDAYIGVVKCDFKNYAIAISYDATSSALKNYNQGFGAYELSINWRGFYKFSNNRAMMRCPRFEDLFEPDAY